MVPDASLLNTQYYKVLIKGKVMLNTMEHCLLILILFFKTPCYFSRVGV